MMAPGYHFNGYVRSIVCTGIDLNSEYLIDKFEEKENNETHPKMSFISEKSRLTTKKKHDYFPE